MASSSSSGIKMGESIATALFNKMGRAARQLMARNPFYARGYLHPSHEII